MPNRPQAEHLPRRNDEHIPGEVKDFVQDLDHHLRSVSVSSVTRLYEITYRALTDRLYSASNWPSPEAISPLVDHDGNFLILYRDLYHRHIFSRLEVSVDIRLDSFQNYINLFDLILGLSVNRPELQLPVSWLWDVVNGFITEYELFHAYRDNTSELGQYESQVLRNQTHAWSTQTILRYLQALLDKCQAENAAPMFETLAQLLLIGQMRVNCLLCDYTSGLEILDGIDFSPNNVFKTVVSCHCTLYYYMGLCYFMLRRFTDAAKTFQYFVSYSSRNELFDVDPDRPDPVAKLVDRMCGMLVLCAKLCHITGADDSVFALIDHKYGEHLRDLHSRDLSVSEAAFSYLFRNCAPTFVNPCVPTASSSGRAHDLMAQLQLRVLLGELRQRHRANELSAYLKLCKSVTLDALAAFVAQSDGKAEQKSSVATRLLCLKHKTRALRWDHQGAPSGGSWASSAVVNFSVNKDTVSLLEHKQAKSHADFFIRHAIKFDNMERDISHLS